MHKKKHEEKEMHHKEHKKEMHHEHKKEHHKMAVKAKVAHKGK